MSDEVNTDTDDTVKNEDYNNFFTITKIILLCVINT